MVKQNDTVVVAGKTARVQAIWAAGAHKTFILDDGRAIVDLDKLVASGDAKVTQQGQTQTMGNPNTVIKKDDEFKHPWRK